MKKILISHILVCCFFGATAQQLDTKNDTVKKNNTLKSFIVPVAFAGTALLLNNSQFEIDAQKRLGGNTRTQLDDYTRFAPALQMYVADIAGVESQNHWFDQTKNLGISLILTDFVTTTLKKNISKERPSRANDNAFPSAHSAYAFTTATVLYEEFKHTSPWLAYSGYGFAVATASLRVIKDAHYISDVLLGSAIGIGIVKLVYALDYLIPWNPFLKNENIGFAPIITGKNYGLATVIKF
jgi:hypothetical protein